MVCLILAPELRNRYEQQRAPTTLNASAAAITASAATTSAVTSPSAPNGGASSSTTMAMFSNYFAALRQQQILHDHAQSGGGGGGYSNGGGGGSTANTAVSASSGNVLVLQWRVPMLSEALSHTKNVESLIATLNPSSVLGGSSSSSATFLLKRNAVVVDGNNSIGGGLRHLMLMPIDNAIGAGGVGGGVSSLSPPMPAESLYFFLFDIEKNKILKPIDPSFSAEELKLSNTGASSGSSVFGGGGVPEVATLSSLAVGGKSAAAAVNSRFGILVASNVGPSLTSFFGPIGTGSNNFINNNNSTVYASSSSTPHPFIPLTASLRFHACGDALRIMGIRRQRIVRSPAAGNTNSLNVLPTNANPFGGGWSQAAIAICGPPSATPSASTSMPNEHHDPLGSSSASAATAQIPTFPHWYDGQSDKPSIVTFRVSKNASPFATSTASSAATTSGNGIGGSANLILSPDAFPSVMIGIMDRKVAESIIVQNSNSNNNSTSANDGAEEHQQNNTANANAAPPSSADPTHLPLPLPYIIQLNHATNGGGLGGSNNNNGGMLSSNGFGGHTMNESSSSSSSHNSPLLLTPPTCIILDASSGTLLAAPLMQQQQTADQSGGDGGGANPTTPAVFAVSDEAEYYPTCPYNNVSSATAAAIPPSAAQSATPITFQLTPPPAGLSISGGGAMVSSSQGMGGGGFGSNSGPSASSSSASSPPVAILRVLCQGQVLHTYAFIASRRQLRNYVPVVQISTPNAVVDVE